MEAIIRVLIKLKYQWWCLLLHFEDTNHRIIERMNPNHPDNNNCEGDLERDAEGELIDI